MPIMKRMNEAWSDLLAKIIHHGDVVSPRGLSTMELPHQQIVVNMLSPVLTIPARKLSYKFMAAEAYWILTGDNRVESISPYNPNIASFSDDGKTFFGAYGPRIMSQLNYVIDKLYADNNTRQAGLTIWRENPPVTKDTPCTVAIFFSIRHGRLNVHVFMRSSDIWLGVPYDVFNFSMLGCLVCCRLHQQYNIRLMPGALYLTAVSSHLYDPNREKAMECINQFPYEIPGPVPVAMYNSEDALFNTLALLRTSLPGHKLRWWEHQ